MFVALRASFSLGLPDLASWTRTIYRAGVAVYLKRSLQNSTKLSNVKKNKREDHKRKASLGWTWWQPSGSSLSYLSFHHRPLRTSHASHHAMATCHTGHFSPYSILQAYLNRTGVTRSFSPARWTRAAASRRAATQRLSSKPACAAAPGAQRTTWALAAWLLNADGAASSYRIQDWTCWLSPSSARYALDSRRWRAYSTQQPPSLQQKPQDWR